MSDPRSVLFQQSTTTIRATTEALPMSSLWNTEDRWLEQEEEDDYNYDYDYDYMLSLSVVQRIAGALSFLGGLYIFWKAWNKRHSAFERIMIGESSKSKSKSKAKAKAVYLVVIHGIPSFYVLETKCNTIQYIYYNTIHYNTT